MQQPQPDNRIRPGFVALLILVLAAVFVPLVMVFIRQSPAGPPGKTQAAAKKPAPASPAAADQTTAIPSDDAAPRQTPLEAQTPSPAGFAPAPPLAPETPWVATPPLSPLEAQWGIRFLSARLALSNSALDVAYQVTDPGKVALLTDGKTTAYLVEPTSGAKTLVCAPLNDQWPFRPHSRARSTASTLRGSGTFPPPAGRLIAGQTYSLLVPNPEGTVKPGGRVAIVIGDVRAGDLTVE